MRISDWSSDVCSSDLPGFPPPEVASYLPPDGLPPALAGFFPPFSRVDDVTPKLALTPDSSSLTVIVLPGPMDACMPSPTTSFPPAPPTPRSVLADSLPLAQPCTPFCLDRKRVVSGKSGSVRGE